MLLKGADAPRIGSSKETGQGKRTRKKDGGGDPVDSSSASALPAATSGAAGLAAKAGAGALASSFDSTAGGPHPCMTEFNSEHPEETVCLILLKSGTLNLQGCSLSVESIKPDTLRYKAPCIYQMPNTTSFIQKCSFRGGGPNKARTAGIFN
jgi:hypothetical protein